MAHSDNASFRKKAQAFLRRYYPTSATYIGLTMIFISAVIFALQRDLSSPNCNFLACSYPQVIVPLVNTVTLALFLPIVGLVVLGATPNNPLWVVLAFVILLAYWYVLQVSPHFLSARIHRRPFAEEWSDEMAKSLEFRLSAFMIVLFMFTLTATTFLYYPRVSITIMPTDFIVTASLVAILLTLYFNKDLDVERDIATARGVTGVALLSISFLVLGLVSTFVSQTSIAPPGGTTAIDVASIEAGSVGLMGGGIMGLFVLIYSMIWHMRPKKKGLEQKTLDV
jgi:hypothetical protein